MPLGDDVSVADEAAISVGVGNPALASRQVSPAWQYCPTAQHEPPQSAPGSLVGQVADGVSGMTAVAFREGGLVVRVDLRSLVG